MNLDSYFKRLVVSTLTMIGLPVLGFFCSRALLNRLWDNPSDEKARDKLNMYSFIGAVIGV